MSQDINTQQSSSTGSAKDTARDQASEVGQRAKGEAGDVASHAKDEAGQVVQQAKQEATHVVDEAREQARNLYDDARGQLQQQAATQTDRVAGGVQQLASGLQALARGNPEDAGPVGDYIEQLGGRLDDFAQRMQSLGYDGVLEETKRYARRRPGTFLMGAAAAGLLVGRMVRGERDRQQSQQPSQAGQTGGSGYYRASGDRLGEDNVGGLRAAPGGGVVTSVAAPLTTDVEQLHDEQVIASDPSIARPAGIQPSTGSGDVADVERAHDEGITARSRGES